MASDPPEKKGMLQQPEAMGNAVGDKVQSTLSPVGAPLGKGLGTVSKPLGGIVEPIVGGIMKGGEGFGEMVGVGFGNKEGGPAKAGDAEQARLKQGEGNSLQTGDNPLGLQQKPE